MSLPLNARDETKGLVGGDLADACLLAQLAGWLPGWLVGAEFKLPLQLAAELPSCNLSIS